MSLEAHRVGPAEPKSRPTGASHIPPRAHRKQFTKEDDEILLAWVQDSVGKGLATAGNKIYETLAQQVRSPAQATTSHGVKLTRVASTTHLSVMEKSLCKELPRTGALYSTVFRN